jgi:hypothetical protein
MIIKDKRGTNLDYTFYELMGCPVRVQRREDRMACFIHTMPFGTMRCIMISKMISSGSGGDGMANRTRKKKKLEI